MEVLQSFICDDVQRNVKCLFEGNQTLFDPYDLAKILGVSNVRESLSSFDNDEKRLINVKTRGGYQNKIMLTSIGVYRLIFSSRKPIAIPFKKWVCRLVENHVNELKKKELDEKDNYYQNILQKYYIEQKDVQEIHQHNAYVEAFSGKNRPVVYIGKIRDYDQNEKKMLIKIGSTKCTTKRSPDLIRTWGDMRIFYVMECDRFREFEEFLQTHTAIKPHVFKDPVHNGHTSNREVFLMNPQEIDKLISIAKRNKHKYQTPYLVSQEDENEISDQCPVFNSNHNQPTMLPNNLNMPNTENDTPHPQRLANGSTIIMPNIIYACDKKREIVARLKGPKIQKYSADGMVLLRTYVSFAEMTRATGGIFARSCVKRAMKKNDIYKNFRWATLDQNLPDSTKQELPPSTNNIDIKAKESRMIALLNPDKTEIQHLCTDQVSTLSFLELSVTSCAIRFALKDEHTVKGYVIKHWEDCDEELQAKFLEYNELPTPRNQYNSKVVLQMDDEGNILRQINSIDRFSQELMIGRKKAHEILKNPDQKYLEFYWRIKQPDQNNLQSLQDASTSQAINTTSEEQTAESQSITHKVNDISCKRYASLLSKYQRYSHQGQLLKTYEAFTDIFTDKSLQNLSASTLKKAIRNKSVYRNCIWLRLPNHCPNDYVQNIHDPIIKSPEEATNAQKPQIVLQWKENTIVKEWGSYSKVCREFKIGKNKLTSILDRGTIFQDSVWTRAR